HLTDTRAVTDIEVPRVVECQALRIVKLRRNGRTSIASCAAAARSCDCADVASGRSHLPDPIIVVIRKVHVAERVDRKAALIVISDLCRSRRTAISRETVYTV